MPNLREMFGRESRLFLGLLVAMVVLHGVWDLWGPASAWLRVAIFGALALAVALPVQRRFARLQSMLSAQLDHLAETAERVERRELSDGPTDHGIPQVDRAEKALLKITGILEEHARLRSQLQVLQRQQVVGQLSRELANDLTNRLTVVLAQLDLALDGMAESDPCKPHLRHAEDAANASVQAIQALLSFDSVDRVPTGPMELNQVAEKVCGLLRRVLDDKVRVVLDLGQDLPVLLGNDAELEQVLMNLGLNARQAMPAGGVLTFRTRRSPEGWAALSVEDTGAGISPALLERIWQPFFSTRHPQEGVGLGLATAKEILRHHGGRIQVESTPGQGSVFTVLLPPLPGRSRAPARAEASRPRPSFAGLRILLAEDEPEIRLVMKELLTRMEAEVVAGIDGEDAWNLWELLGPFDLLITDQRMPRLNGLELLGRVRATRRDFPVLVMTGYGLEEAATVLGGDPRARLLAKPFTVPALLEALHDLLPVPKVRIQG